MRGRSSYSWNTPIWVILKTWCGSSTNLSKYRNLSLWIVSSWTRHEGLQRCISKRTSSKVLLKVRWWPTNKERHYLVCFRSLITHLITKCRCHQISMNSISMTVIVPWMSPNSIMMMEIKFQLKWLHVSETSNEFILIFKDCRLRSRLTRKRRSLSRLSRSR